MALITYNFQSQYLNLNEQVTIILPDKPSDQSPKEFFGNGKKYKVLWLLHGGLGDSTDWVRLTKVELYACEKDLIVVMPSALNSSYMNWPNFNQGYNMWDFLTEELMPVIYNWFPASDRREDNFIAGLSMGGLGASSYALFHPEKFAAMASFSYAPLNYHQFDDRLLVMAGMDRRAFENQLENVGGREGILNSPYNSWDQLFNQTANGDGESPLSEYDPKTSPKLFFYCGTNDFLYPNYLELKQEAISRGRTDIVFKEYEGYTHEWRLWDMAIEDFIHQIDPSPEIHGNKELKLKPSMPVTSEK